jgi:Mrp family chromosome partitioning ATPase
MSRIYDALENYREMGATLHEPMPAPPLSVPLIGQTNGNEVGLELEMTTLYQTITAALPDSPHRSILFVGSRSKEGTSTIARELAKTVSLRMGKEVLLVDCDGSCNGLVYPDADPDLKLEEVLATGKQIEKVLCPVDGTSLSILPLFRWAASPRPQTVDFGNGGGFWNLLKEKFELVVVDFPPAMMFANGPSIISLVDGVVIVVEAEKTRWQVALSVKEKIVKSGGTVLGIVFNKQRHYIPQFIYNRL